MGIGKTVLLPAGRPVTRPSTRDGRANGLAAKSADGTIYSKEEDELHKMLLTGTKDFREELSSANSEDIDNNMPPSIISKSIKEKRVGWQCSAINNIRTQKSTGTACS